MKRVFLTGGNGFFGTRFREAHHHNFEILSTDVEEMNILEKEKVYDALNLFKPDYVIHAAAVALTDYCNDNPEKCREIECCRCAERSCSLQTRWSQNGLPEQ